MKEKKRKEKKQGPKNIYKKRICSLEIKKNRKKFKRKD